MRRSGRGMVGVNVIGMMIWVISVISGKLRVEAEVYHLVGGDRGWDPSTDIAAWSSSTTFTLGDNVWFSYSRAEGKIAELKTKEEYESCDVRNPIKMYTDGLNTIKLDEEGIRYFVSTNSDHCKNGLKLHVDVLPQAMPFDSPKVITSESDALQFAAAAGPTPTGSAPLLAVNCNLPLLVAAVVCLFYTLLIIV